MINLLQYYKESSITQQIIIKFRMKKLQISIITIQKFSPETYLSDIKKKCIYIDSTSNTMIIFCSILVYNLTCVWSNFTTIAQPLSTLCSSRIWQRNCSKCTLTDISWFVKHEFHNPGHWLVPLASYKQHRSLNLGGDLAGVHLRGKASFLKQYY